MSVIAWEVTRYSEEPKRVEFVRETASFYVRSDGRRDAKETSYSKFYADHGEALAAIKRRISGEEGRKRDELVRKAAPALFDALEKLVALINADCCLDKATQEAEAAIASARGVAQ